MVGEPLTDGNVECVSSISAKIPTVRARSGPRPPPRHHHQHHRCQNAFIFQSICMCVRASGRRNPSHRINRYSVCVWCGGRTCGGTHNYTPNSANVRATRRRDVVVVGRHTPKTCAAAKQCAGHIRTNRAQQPRCRNRWAATSNSQLTYIFILHLF